MAIVFAGFTPNPSRRLPRLEYICYSCNRPLPTAIAATPRFARSTVTTPDDDYASWGDETRHLLEYIEGVLSALIGARDFAGDEAVNQLRLLGLDLVQEAQRRLQKLQQAAEIWEQRVRENTTWHASGEER